MADKYTAKILNGQSVSKVVDLGPRHLFGILMPAAFDGTLMSFLADAEGDNNFQPIYDENGSEKQITIGTNRLILLDPLPWLGIRYFQLRSGVLATPTVQTADRTLTLLTVQ